MILPFSKTSNLVINREGDDATWLRIVEIPSRKHNELCFLEDEFTIFLKNIFELKSFSMNLGAELIVEQKDNNTHLTIKIKGRNYGGLDIASDEIEKFLSIMKRYERLVLLQ